MEKSSMIHSARPHSLASSEHFFRLKYCFVYYILKSAVRPDERTTCAKTLITTGRPSGSIYGGSIGREGSFFARKIWGKPGKNVARWGGKFLGVEIVDLRALKTSHEEGRLGDGKITIFLKGSRKNQTKKCMVTKFCIREKFATKYNLILYIYIKNFRKIRDRSSARNAIY